jgi:hypothetical protein
MYVRFYFIRLSFSKRRVGKLMLRLPEEEEQRMVKCVNNRYKKRLKDNIRNFLTYYFIPWFVYTSYSSPACSWAPPGRILLMPITTVLVSGNVTSSSSSGF